MWNLSSRHLDYRIFAVIISLSIVIYDIKKERDNKKENTNYMYIRKEKFV